MEMNRIALIVSVVAFIVSFTVWAINSPSSPFYDHGEPYLNDVGATINTSSKTAQHERYYVNDSVRVGIGYTNDQPSSKLIISSDVGIGDGMNENLFVPNIKNTTENKLIVGSPNNKIFEIQAPQETKSLAINSFDAVLNRNSTMEIYNVGKGFQYRKIIINTNQTKIIIKGGGVIENVSMLIWDRENNSIEVN